MKKAVYVCYEMDNDSFCYNVVRKVVADESQAIAWAEKGSHTDFGPTKSCEKFEVEELEESKQANEWYYPSKGEYPKENKLYLCKIKAFVGGGITYECFDYDIEYNSWKGACGDVIAWKEIVFPEERG